MTTCPTCKNPYACPREIRRRSRHTKLNRRLYTALDKICVVATSASLDDAKIGARVRKIIADLGR